MLIRPSSFSRCLLLASGLLAAAALPLRAQEAPPKANIAPVDDVVVPSIIENSSMETDADADGWPDGWPMLKSGGSWESEEGNHFIRMTSTTPGSMVMLYREINLPDGVGALEMTWRQRTTNLKRGKKSWFDARIMMEFMDAGRGKVSPSPKAPSTSKNSDGWQTKTTSFLVPEGAAILKFMPALFNVESGTYDLDDIVLKPVDAAPLAAAAAEAAAARAEKLAASTAARQAKVAASLEAGGAIISNGDFETADKKGDWPAGWARNKDGAWGTEENGNRFLRLTSTEPGKTTMVYRSVTLPAGVPAFELSLRWRITDLKPGELGWHDARIMMDIKDASGHKLKPQPKPIYTRKNTKGQWAERSVSFLVPEGGVALDIMPSLFQVKAGTLEIDDIVLKPVDAAAILAKQKEREAIAAKARVPVETDHKEKWPDALRAEGNRLVSVEDGHEVWLQGMNVASLEWSVRGEQVHKSIVVGLDEWNGNVIRLPVKEDYWFGKAASDGGEAYRAIVDQAVTLAANRGSYLVLDLHRYRAPKEEYIKFWKDAATRYKNHPAVIFDLMNEPHGTTWEVWRDGGFIGTKKEGRDETVFLTAEEKKALDGYDSPGMQALLDAVRSTGAKNLVVVGGLDYAYDLSGIVKGFGLTDKTGNGIMYACHIYPWKRNWQKKLLDAAALHPILLGEVGANDAKMSWLPADQQEDASTWVPAILGLIQKHKLNWTAWCFHPKSGPRMLLDWNYTPTPDWGQPAKDALSGKQFPPPDRLR